MLSLLDVYSLSQLQTISHFLTHLEGEAITDVSVIRGLIERQFHDELLRMRQSTAMSASRDQRIATRSAMTRERVQQASGPLCPGCGARLSPVANSEGLDILGCRSCRYSTVLP